ncbi:MAG: TerB N-terminal domain-containing protein, partial [Abditibacteriota bacterium]|nr:TerB N-terminal domain-containing protein [Abditibacteriota bacterium]
MTIAELTDYAAQKYNIREEEKQIGVPGFSVLAHPETGMWAAAILRRQDPETGAEAAVCDIKCGRKAVSGLSAPYLTPPARMRGSDWIGVAITPDTDRDTVFGLFDKALASLSPGGFTLVVRHRPSPGKYTDTPIPFSDSAYKARQAVSGRLRKMRRVGPPVSQRDSTDEERFYRQAVFMQDFEDDYPWKGSLDVYYPTYRDMTDLQLRGYFSWRARVRRGEYGPIPISCAYVYAYELINGVGGDSPEECFCRLRDFEKGFSEAGFGAGHLRVNVRRWLLEMAVVNALPRELALEAVDPEILRYDARLAALAEPEDTSDDELFEALRFYGGKRLDKSPAAEYPVKGKRLFCQAWRTACRDKDAFHYCFGEPFVDKLVPFENAVYYPF